MKFCGKLKFIIILTSLISNATFQNVTLCSILDTRLKNTPEHIGLDRCKKIWFGEILLKRGGDIGTTTEEISWLCRSVSCLAST